MHGQCDLFVKQYHRDRNGQGHNTEKTDGRTYGFCNLAMVFCSRSGCNQYCGSGRETEYRAGNGLHDLAAYRYSGNTGGIVEPTHDKQVRSAI